MSRPEICPTCGIKLGPTQPRPETRVCSACSRSNPAGFNYCGFCATPMENTEMGARMADLAAPPGGWPSLTSELVEVRFYLQQGLFDDAYELLSIMQKRHPGHPQLNELTRRPKPTRRVDTGVLALVDSVLAESANLVAKVPRRAATRFTAPAQGGADRTDVHSVVGEEEQTTRAPKTPKTGPQSPTRRSGSQPRAAAAAPAASTTTGSQRAPKTPSGSQRTTTGPKPTAPAPRAPATGRAAAAAPEPAAPRERTRIYRAVEPPPAARTAAPAPARAAAAPQPAVTGRTVASRPPQSGHTVVVDALQAPAPYPDAPEDSTSRGARPKKRRDAPAKPAPARGAAATPPAAAPAAPATDDKPEPRRRATFGQHVLNRLR